MVATEKTVCCSLLPRERGAHRATWRSSWGGGGGSGGSGLAPGQEPSWWFPWEGTGKVG